MVIKNGFVFTKQGIFEKVCIRIEAGRITEVGTLVIPSDEEEVLDATGKYVVPGFVDIHTHGAVGHDLCDGNLQGLCEIAAYERSVGVTSFCPTSMALPTERLQEIFRMAGSVIGDSDAGRVGGAENNPLTGLVGIHMEGPYLNPAKKGAQKGDYLQMPDVRTFAQLQECAGGCIRLLTLAPELPGAMDFLTAVKDSVKVSLGHSLADYDCALEAFDRGADHVTHLYNAMPGYDHRSPGIVGAAADRKQVTAELICDGFHVHPAVIRSTFRMFGSDRICLISDSMEATGMPDGVYQLGGQSVYKKGREARLADGTLAGSVTNLSDCFRLALHFGIPAEDALKAVTVNPARSIGMLGEIGVLDVGARADILVMDENWQLERVL